MYIFTTGFSFNVSVAAGTLAISIFVPQIYKGQVSGLLGNYDGNPNNDFRAPDDSLLSVNANEREIFTYASQCKLKRRSTDTSNIPIPYVLFTCLYCENDS